MGRAILLWLFGRADSDHHFNRSVLALIDRTKDSESGEPQCERRSRIPQGNPVACALNTVGFFLVT
jgi:hypothetical protein